MRKTIYYNNVKKALLMLSLMLLMPLSVMAAGKFVLVVDAGHGGKDAGCVGKISKEKHLALKYALAFGKMVERNCPDVKVVYTRTTDRFLELWQRAEIANKNKADLFLSFHINSVGGSKSVRGYQTYTLGRSMTTGSQAGIRQNLEVAKRENSVISMEKDYKQRYQGFDPNSPESNILFEFIQDANMERSVELSRLMQKHVCAATGRLDKGAHQNNLAVLRLTSMPGCLLELGFISNPDEERFLNAESSVNLYSRGILKAFIAYKNKYFDGLNVPYRPSDVKETEIPQIVPEEYKEKGSEREVKEEKKGSEKEVKEERKGSEREVKEEKKGSEKEVKEEKKGSEKTPEKEPEPPKENAKEPAQEAKATDSNDAAPVFKIQISIGRAKLSPNDRQFKGIAGVEYYEEGGFYKYTVGNTTDYNDIARQRREILSKFPEAFIIAFKDGKKMNVNEAISEFKARRK